jgi:hypothetical protein
MDSGNWFIRNNASFQFYGQKAALAHRKAMSGMMTVHTGRMGLDIDMRYKAAPASILGWTW